MKGVQNIMSIITQISKDQASQLIDNGTHNGLDFKNSSGLYYLMNGNIHTALDYSSSEGFVEDFESENQCFSWLKGEFETSDDNWRSIYK